MAAGSGLGGGIHVHEPAASGFLEIWWQRALQSEGEGLDQQLDEATLARLAETIGSSKTLSKGQLDDMAKKIQYSGLKHKINPDHPEKNLKKVIDQLTPGERDLLKSRLHDL